jgi:hypothetical protein
MKKVNWSKVKDRIINIIRFIIFTVVMLVGFWAVYVVAWKALGFTVNDTALWLLFVQAIISETMFIKWFSKE